MPPLPNVVVQKTNSQDDPSYDPNDDANSKENDDPLSFGNGVGSSPEQNSAVAAAAMEQVDEFDEILVESASDYDFPERFRYFMGPFKITYDNRIALEYCIIAEAAGIIVDQNTVANKGQLPTLITEEYAAIIKQLDTTLFASDELRKDMYTRLAGGRMDKYGSKKMWKYWQEIKSDMKKIFTSLPTTYHKMKSGSQLYDVFNTLIRDHWKTEYVSCVVCCIVRFIYS